jgi:hypothetical protein
VISRRAALAAPLAAAVLPGRRAMAETTAATEAELARLLADPAQRLRLRARLFGSERTATVHRMSVGHVWALTPDRPLRTPMVSVINYAVAEWTPAGDGFDVRGWDSAVYCRFGTTELLDWFDNPLTGARTQPVAFLLGPMESRLRPGADPSAVGGAAVARPRDLPLNVSGGHLTWPVASSRTLPNPLDAARFPASWGSPALSFELFAAFSARVADLLDPAQPQAPATSRYDELTPWPYWMEMGARPGQLIAHGAGAKLGRLEDAPPAWLAALRAGVPAMFAPSRWTTPRNDLTEFLRSRGG